MFSRWHRWDASWISQRLIISGYGICSDLPELLSLETIHRMFCPLVTHTILKFCPILAINLSKVSKALFYSVSHSFDCNDLTEEQWRTLSLIPGLADHVLWLSSGDIMCNPQINVPFNHCPKLYSYIINRLKRSGDEPDRVYRDNKMISQAIYSDDLELIPVESINIYNEGKDCTLSYHLLKQGLDYKRAYEYGLHPVALITHIYDTTGLLCPSDSIIVSPRLSDMIYSGYQSIIKDSCIQAPSKLSPRDSRVAIDNIMKLDLRLIDSEGSTGSLREYLRLIPIISSSLDPYIPLYERFIRYALNTTTSRDVSYCQIRSDLWFWLANIDVLRWRNSLVDLVDRYNLQFPTIRELRYCYRRMYSKSLPDDHDLLTMRFKDIPDDDSMPWGIIAKILVHRFYDQLDYTDILHMMQEELIQSSKDDICRHLMEELTRRLITKNEGYNDLRLSSVKIDNICNQYKMGRRILEELIRREKKA